MTSARRVLVTGAQGLLGRLVVATFLAADEGTSVVGVGRSPRTDGFFTHDLAWAGRSVRAPLPQDLRVVATNPRYRYVEIDLRHGPAVTDLLGDIRPDVVVHSAAALRDEPWPALAASNIDSVVGLLTAIGHVPGERPTVVLASSGSVYGVTPPERLPHREDDLCLPADLYAASKRASEDVARILGATYDVPVAVARAFNLLGPGLQDRHLAATLAGQVAAVALGLTPPVLRIAPLDTTRDFVDVRDAAAAIHAIATRGGRGTFNVASGAETPVQRIFDELVARAGIADRVHVELQPRRQADLPRSYADVSRLRALGFTPAHAFGDTLQEMLDYYLEVVGPGAAA